MRPAVKRRLVTLPAAASLLLRCDLGSAKELQVNNMTRLEYEVPSTKTRWRCVAAPALFGFVASAVIALGAGTASTLAKWIFQARVGRTPLQGLPNTPRYQFLIEELPFWAGTGLLACLFLWSLWRIFARGDRVGFMVTAAAACVAWWAMVFVVAGNSFDAFP